jgi:SAM-dependent methyltransferase
MELLIGCGRNHTKRVTRPGHETWTKLITLDINPDHKPDVLHDLEEIPLPFDDDAFDEIHAYEVLEHTGRQGDYRFFFRQFEDFWRILKPGGVLCGTSPRHDRPWAWGDPGHTRIISSESFIFLDQTQYVQVGRGPMSDYRFCYKADFSCLYDMPYGTDCWSFVLQAIKPARQADAP